MVEELRQTFKYDEKKRLSSLISESVEYDNYPEGKENIKEIVDYKYNNEGKVSERTWEKYRNEKLTREKRFTYDYKDGLLVGFSKYYNEYENESEGTEKYVIKRDDKDRYIAIVREGDAEDDHAYPVYGGEFTYDDKSGSIYWGDSFGGTYVFDENDRLKSKFSENEHRSMEIVYKYGENGDVEQICSHEDNEDEQCAGITVSRTEGKQFRDDH